MTAKSVRFAFEDLEARCVPASFVVDPAGSDGNDGVNNPWLTLQHAANSVGPGDTVTASAGDPKAADGAVADYAVQCVNQSGEVLIEGRAGVAVPS